MRDGTFRQNGSADQGWSFLKLYCPAAQKNQSMEKDKKKSGMKERGARQQTFLGSGIWHLQGIERGVPKAARQSGGLQKKNKT
jgi:hypothetical protein